MKDRKLKQERTTIGSLEILVAVILTLTVFLSVLLFASVRWMFSWFSNPKMDEIVYELSAPLQGTGSNMIPNYILTSLLPAIAASACAGGSAFICRKKKRYLRFAGAGIFLFGILFLVSGAYAAKRVGLVSYLRNRNQRSDFIEKYYVDPQNVEIEFPDLRRNLIFLYLESMETTFADVESGGAFEENHIPQLTQLAMENEDFSGSEPILCGGYSMPGSTWTIAAMYATTSGLPLHMALNDNAMSSQDSFFSNIVTLGDILKTEGYRQVFLLGSDATFGGRRVYYTDHGNFEIRDYPYAIQEGWIPEDYKKFWGFEDQKLFTYAKDTLTELAGGEQPFHLTMLTVDTHMPKGYRCSLCRDDFPGSQYGNAVACSDRQVMDFIRWVQEQEFYENTTIIITGDHPTMAAGFCDEISSDYLRKTYTCVINAPVVCENPETRRDYTTFDLFPTALTAIGAKIEGERLGLGTNLYSSIATLSEKVGYQIESTELEKHSDFLLSLEELDEGTQDAVNTFRFADPPGIAVDRERKTIGFAVPDLSSYGKQIVRVSVKVWYYKGQEYVHSSRNLELQEDGSWFGVIKAGKFMDTDTANYQMYVNVSGAGTVNLGREGGIRINQ